MKLSAHGKIRIGFWLLPVIPVLLFFFAFRTSSALVDSADDVAHTNEVLRNLDDLLSHLKDVEVAQREYVLTGKESYLKPIDEDRKRIEEVMAVLQTLTSTNQRQRDRLQVLAPVIPQKFEEVKKTISRFQEEGFEAAKQLVTDQSGKQPMDDIRTVITRMIAEEKALLDSRSSEQSRDFVKTMSLIGVMLVVNGVLSWFLYSLLKRDLAEHNREEIRMREINQELENRVAQRTEALRRSNEDLQQFAYVASHDLQEPLRMVASYTELLQKRYKGKLDQDADDFIFYIVDGVRRMSNLIRGLLDYSRAGETTEEPIKPVDTERALVTVLGNLKASIDDFNAEITHDPLPSVQCHPLRMQQLLQNLISNAIKYRGDRKPQVHISAVDNGKEVVFTVKDNGIGIAPEYFDEIFGVFKRLHGREYEGTGIGLAMCKKIIERHGGRIWVESTPGEGSTFHFTIPHPEAARAARA
jgi:signal transduction histidine kinase